MCRDCQRDFLVHACSDNLPVWLPAHAYPVRGARERHSGHPAHNDKQQNPADCLLASAQHCCIPAPAPQAKVAEDMHGRSLPSRQQASGRESLVSKTRTAKYRPRATTPASSQTESNGLSAHAYPVRGVDGACKGAHLLSAAGLQEGECDIRHARLLHSPALSGTLHRPRHQSLPVIEYLRMLKRPFLAYKMQTSQTMH